MTPTFSVSNLGQRQREDADIWSRQASRLIKAQQQHAERIQQSHGTRAQQLWADWLRLGQDLTLSALQGKGASDAAAYSVDAAQRLLLTLDTLRERGDGDPVGSGIGMLKNRRASASVSRKST